MINDRANQAISAVKLEAICKRFGSVIALDDVNLEVVKGEFCSILGPSGCGKTTLLRIIGGFEKPDSGGLWIDGVDAHNIPPQKRPVNTVFQSYALFPHLTVFQNIAFGLKMAGVSADHIRQRVRQVMDLVQVSGLEKRMPHEISGGQRQRVALARALVNQPGVLLLDEPLAAVDAKLRKQLQSELRSLQRQLKITFIYVTHDQDEALSMSDRIVLMNHGRIEQVGTPRQVYNHPLTRFAALFLGGCNLVEGNLSNSNGGHMLSGKLGNFRVAGNQPRNNGPATFAIRPERIELDFLEKEENCIQGIVQEIVFNGSQTEMMIDSHGISLRVVRPSSESTRHRPQPGNRISLHFPPDALVPLED